MNRDVIASFRLTKLNKEKLENWSKENGMSMSDTINALITILNKDIYIEYYVDNFQTNLLGTKITEKIKIKEPIEKVIKKNMFN